MNQKEGENEVTQNIIYATWGIGFNKIVKFEKQSKVERAHQLGKPYDLVIGADPQNPDYFLEFGINGFIHIGFLDNLKRVSLMCFFSTELPGKVFLYSASYPQYEGVLNEVIKRTNLNFTTDGDYIIADTNYSINETMTYKAQKKVDVSVLWTDYPEFGHYDNLIAVTNNFTRNVNEVLEEIANLKITGKKIQ